MTEEFISPAYYDIFTQEMKFEAKQPNNLIISKNNSPMVTISLEDGNITYGSDYNPDEAAEIFWSAMVGEYKEYLKWKNASK